MFPHAARLVSLLAAGLGGEGGCFLYVKPVGMLQAYCWLQVFCVIWLLSRVIKCNSLLLSVQLCVDVRRLWLELFSLAAFTSLHFLLFVVLLFNFLLIFVFLPHNSILSTLFL